MAKKLSHYDAAGRARMVDVSGKADTRREAEASAFVCMTPAVLKALPKNPKGDPLEVARLAGIMAAKRTSELIPMCHALPLSHVDVEMRLCENGVAITTKVATTAATEVEMEALVAAGISALTLYDMLKGWTRAFRFGRLCWNEKSGARAESTGGSSKSMPNDVKLLLVDDNPMILGMLQHAWRRSRVSSPLATRRMHCLRPSTTLRSLCLRLPHAGDGWAATG